METKEIIHELRTRRGLSQDELAEKFTVDGVRYYALSEMPYSADGSITYESVISRFNTDLVNNLGNLVKRTLDMQKKYFDRVVAAPVPLHYRP